MNYAQLSLIEQLILTLSAMVLLTSFLLLAQTRIISLINTFAAQGFLLFLGTCLIAQSSGRYHLYISAGITLALKVFFIPWQLRRLVKRLDIRRDVENVGGPSMIMIAGGALVLFSYYVALPIRELSTLATRNTIAISLAIILLGMLMMITRRKAVAQLEDRLLAEDARRVDLVTPDGQDLRAHLAQPFIG